MIHRPALLVTLTAAFWPIPNEPSARWYAVPEIVCDFTHSDQDEWRCDEPPVLWEPHEITRR
jgi:hypothetical protein